MSNCPCCDSKLLRHARSRGVYWFCPECYQEMSNLESLVQAAHTRKEQKQKTLAGRKHSESS